ncbi:MAG: hypothetical protein ACIAQF_06040 [Phycisphaerales bacterium JB065]
MLRSIFGCSLLALAGLTGCASSESSSESAALNTVHVWELDHEATRQAAATFLMDRTPPEVQDEQVSYAVLQTTGEIFSADAYLELVSDGTYRWQSAVGEDRFVSMGTWTHNETRSGARIYLQPDETKLEGENHESGIEDWLLLADTDRMQLRIIVPGYPGPVMRRAD